MGGAKSGVPDVQNAAHFEPVAWWWTRNWTRNQIGRDLRECYEVPKELPSTLQTLILKVDAIEGNQLRPVSKSLTSEESEA
jgi:hypothetical protein